MNALASLQTILAISFKVSNHWLQISRRCKPGNIYLSKWLSSIISDFTIWFYVLVWAPVAFSSLLLHRTALFIEVDGCLAYTSHVLTTSAGEDSLLHQSVCHLYLVSYS
ncbi:hypothetical protein EWB00_003347 [Schistosoma japonicum]|uniref:Uncharacterized protein n=1 Tax=Schistosoma japonicum TaxID=6182 RepID=A0A4Z2D8W5_SCHJA|nr:hypothetical protein EWB00_003347 [Schistosoma japonicum]